MATNVAQLRSTDAPASDADTARPHNVEAEQALLGALLLNNDLVERIEGYLEAEHFYDPAHRDLYGLICKRSSRNQIADANTLKLFIDDFPGLLELGGHDYLVRLAQSSISAHASRHYAEVIRDLAMRRELIGLGMDVAAQANSVDVDLDAQQLIEDAEQRLYSLAETGREEGGFKSFLGAAKGAVKIALEASQRKSGISGMSTGFIDLDRKLGGLHRSDLVIIAGRPSMGKTALATNIAFHIASRHGQPTDDGDPDTLRKGIVGFFSLEMSSEQLASRILADRSGVPTSRIRRNDLDADQFGNYAREASALEACPLYIDDTPAIPISLLAARARRLQRTHGLDLLIVDYIQLIRPASFNGNNNRAVEVSEITQGLKAIAKELNIPVIGISQLSRQVESRDDKRPQLSDLRESGSIEQDADIVMFVYRREYYVERTKPDETDAKAMERWQQKMNECHGRAEVIVGKHRHGPIGSVELSFTSQFTRFGNVAPRDMPEDGDHGF